MKVKLSKDLKTATLENGDVMKAKKGESAEDFKGRVTAHVLDEFLDNAVFTEEAAEAPAPKEEKAPAKSSGKKSAEAPKEAKAPAKKPTVKQAARAAVKDEENPGVTEVPEEVNVDDPKDVAAFNKAKRAAEREERLAQIKADREAHKKAQLAKIEERKKAALEAAELAAKKLEEEEEKRLKLRLKEEEEKEKKRREREAERAKAKAKRDAEDAKAREEAKERRKREKEKRDAQREKQTKEAAKKIVEFAKKQADAFLADAKAKAAKMVEDAKAKAEALQAAGGKGADLELVEAARLMKGKAVTFIPQGQTVAVHGTIRGASADKRTGYVFYRIVDEKGVLWRKNYHAEDLVIKP